MSVEVIKRREPNEATREFDCKRCGSTLRYKLSEATTEVDQDEVVHVVTCPVCSSINWLAT